MLTANDTLLAKDLARFVDPVEIYDVHGKLLGLFVPANLERGKHLYAQLSESLDRAEMARRKAETKPGHGWQELIKKFQAAKSEDRENRVDVIRSSTAETGTCRTP